MRIRLALVVGVVLAVVAAAVVARSLWPANRPTEGRAAPGPGASAAPTPTSLRSAPITGKTITGAVPASCTTGKAGDGRPLPDRSCTPGVVAADVRPDTRATTICKAGWTATIRPPTSQTTPLERRLLAAYHQPPEPARFELDHLVPLSLGGHPTDVANLWPQLNDRAGGNTKDDVEGVLQRAVCAGRVPLADAQVAIATDWTTARIRLGV